MEFILKHNDKNVINLDSPDEEDCFSNMSDCSEKLDEEVHKVLHRFQIQEKKLDAKEE